MAHVSSLSSDFGSENKNDNFSFELCDKLESLTPQQIRIVLFKECRFKECQLLFDSFQNGDQNEDPSDGSYCKDPKLNAEFNSLTEMIFGSTAMRYNGTHFKAHDLSSPHRIIFTQVFSSPYRKHLKPFKMKTNKSSFDYDPTHSMEVRKTSSVETFLSDSEIFFRKENITNDTSSTFTTIDSGYSDQSFVRNSSSSYFGSFINRTSFNSKDSLLTPSRSSKESCAQANMRFTRFGLAVIIGVTAEKDIYRDFFMKHITFVESLLTRLRRYADLTYQAPSFFMSVMSEISNESIHWLVDFSNTLRCWSTEKVENIPSVDETGSSAILFGFSGIGRFIQQAWNSLRVPRITPKQPFDVFCQFIGKVEVKEKKFFLSSLITEVLTYHLGWVGSCYKPFKDNENSYNALWGQLMDLRGSTSRISRIIIYGNDEKLIKTTLDCVHYFLRYFKVQRRDIERDNIPQENNIVDFICDNEYGKPEGSTLSTTGLKRTKNAKSFGVNLRDLAEVEDIAQPDDQKPVLFILGDNDKLVDLKKTMSDDRFIHYPKTLTKKHSFSCLSSKENHADNTESNSRSNRWFIGDDCAVDTKMKNKMRVLTFPLPKMKCNQEYCETIPYEFSMQNRELNKFIPDMVLQGTLLPENKWRSQLCNDLSFHSYSHSSNDGIQEAVAILGNTETWDVEVISSKRSSLRASCLGKITDASELISSTLDVVLQMWNLRISNECCKGLIERRLTEVCMRARALAELLLATDFCTTDVLISTLHLRVIDIPLLMSVASHIRPEISQKYGLSYQ